VQDKMKEDETKEKEKKSPKLFEGRTARHSSSCCSKIFMSWIEPMVDYANVKDQKLTIDSYGELGESDKMDAFFEKLEKNWNAVKHTKNDQFVLFKTLFSTFKEQYFTFVFWNTF